MANADNQPENNENGKNKNSNNTNTNDDDFDLDLPSSEIGGVFRGIAVAARVKLPILKAVSAKAVRSVGGNRSLAFASEGAVAGNALMPRWMYYGAWGLSGLAIGADITSKTWDAPEEKKWETAGYWTAFHVPASLVVPAVVIHQIVHATEYSIEHHSYAKKIPVRFRPYFPVGAALLSIVPIVPAIDHVAELIMEPTLGDYLGLKFDHHHHHHHEEDGKTPPIESGHSKEKKD